MKWLSLVLLVLSLSACSGKESSIPAGKAGAAAAACDTFVKNKLDGKLYKLDLNQLAASLKEGADSTGSLHAPIIIEPGLATELKQSIQCEIRFTADNKPEVFTVTFIW